MTAESLAEAVVFAGAALAAAGIATSGVVRRELSENPWLGLIALAALLALAVPVWLLALDPVWRRALAMILIALLAFGWYRARPVFGARRGLPPGSLGLYDSLRAVADENFYAEGFGRWGHVFKMSQLQRSVICIGDLALARDLLRHEGGALGQVNWPFNRLLPGKYVEFMDGEQHARMRALFEPGFGPGTLQACADDLRAAARAAVAELRQPPGRAQAAIQEAAQDPTCGVAPFPVCQDLAYRALLRLLVGIDPGDPRVAGIPSMLAQLDRDVHPWLPVSAASRRAFAELAGVLKEVGAEFVPLPGEAVPRSVLGDLVRRDPGLLDDALVIANLATLLQNGRVMLRMLLAWLVKRAGDHPGSFAAIRAALSDERHAETRAREFILEVLRLDVGRYLYREAVADCRLGPYRVPEGWLVRVCLREAHRDPQFFDRPLAFDPGRFAENRFGANRFWPFGAAIHACFAERFVMAVAGQFLLALAAHEVRVLADGPRERVNRHWAFALPSSQLRVSVADVAPVPGGPGPVRVGSTYA